MFRLLFLLAMVPCSAQAAGLDITADELNQDSYGTIIAKGNVIIKQRPARTLQKIQITPSGWKTVIADFDVSIDASTAANQNPAQHRSLTLKQSPEGWKIISDQIISGQTGENANRAKTAATFSELSNSIKAWRQAWSDQNLNAYFATYRDTFKPDGRFDSTAAWRAYKKRVISSKAFIRVDLEDIRIEQKDDSHATAEFIQYFESSGVNSRDLKRLEFELEQGGWKIISESIIPKFTLAHATTSMETPEGTVKAWKNVWNRRDLDAYLALYAADIFPSPAFSSRQSWVKSLQKTFAEPANRTIRADSIRFNRAQHTIRAEGHVQLQSVEGRIEAESAEMDSETKAGEIQQATLYLPNGERLQARRLTRINDTLFEAEEARFTACPEDEEAWTIRAKSARLDQHEGKLTARQSSFEVAGVPILYTPWWSQTLKRKTGLLTPKFGTGKRRGTELGIPLYIAPAANWDTTLTPVWMSARGVMGDIELRHVSQIGHERLQAVGINDHVTHATRSRLQGDIQWQLPADVLLDVQADHVSDHLYLADYAAGSDTSKRYLQSTATLSQPHFSDGIISRWSLMGQHQQDITKVSNADTLDRKSVV